MRNAGHSPYGSCARAHDGVIVQFVFGDGERRTLVKQGQPPDSRLRGGNQGEGVEGSLRRAIVEMETWPGEWQIEVISTPTTIYRDLQGSRIDSSPTGPRDAHGLAGSGDVAETRLVTPEAIMLGRIGRLDLLAR